MMRRVRTTSLATLAVAAMVAGIASCRRPGDADGEVGTATASTATRAVPAPWRAAERRSYQLAFRSHLMPQGSNDQITLGWTGTLTLTALSVRDERAELVAEFTGIAETNQDAEATADLDLGLKQPFFPVVAADGRILEVGLMPQVSTAVASGWKALLGDIQFVGSTVRSQSWEADEIDPTGRYRARYTQAGDPGVWKKTKSSYLALHPRGALAPGQAAYTVENAEGVFRFDAAARLSAVVVNERVRTVSEPPIPPFVAETRISLQLEETSAVAPASMTALAGARAQARFSTLASGPDERMRRDELDRGALANVSVPELLANLDAGSPRDQAARERRARVRKLLGALLRQQRGHTSEIEQRVQALRDDRDELLEILRDAGTPEAQEALRRVIDLPALPVRDRISAAQSLGMVRQPTPNTVVYLQNLVDHADLGTQARFSLASTVARMREIDPPLAARTIGFLLDRLARAGNASDALTYVQALGNSGDARTLDALERRVRAPAVEIRHAALWSLRSVENRRAEDLLIGVATATDESDRAVALKTLAFRPLTPRSEATLAARLRDDPSPRARQQVLAATRHALRRSPALRNAFEWCRRNDANAGLRDTASRALAAFPMEMSSAVP